MADEPNIQREQEAEIEFLKLHISQCRASRQISGAPQAIVAGRYEMEFESRLKALQRRAAKKAEGEAA